MLNFLKIISIPTLIILILIFLEQFLFPNILFHKMKWFLLAFFIFQVYATNKITEFGLSEDKIKFQNYYFVTMIIRLILAPLVLGVFYYIDSQNIILLVINFFIFYFFYFVFEIYYLLANLRANS